MSDTKHVVLGVTGSIAAYKAADLVRQMKSRGWDVSVVMTAGAMKFVGELTFRTLSRNPVAVDMFDPSPEWCPEHISLADRADVFVVAPCTANVLAKMASGISDDLLTCTFLAVTAPVIIAPAMNEKMWDNQATRANVETLKVRGIDILDVAEGDLACGYQGRGRLAPLDQIMKAIEDRLS
jgi:phosphopantothenoylcysteine synthetase/decarboxylase